MPERSHPATVSTPEALTPAPKPVHTTVGGIDYLRCGVLTWPPSGRDCPTVWECGLCGDPVLNRVKHSNYWHPEISTVAAAIVEQAHRD